jgi:predicted lysophospholipase L1 biosynthesis ABC-type transport system permease subunit
MSTRQRIGTALLVVVVGLIVLILTWPICGSTITDGAQGSSEVTSCQSVIAIPVPESWVFPMVVALAAMIVTAVVVRSRLRRRTSRSH